MKSKTIKAALLSLALASAFVSCKKDETTSTNNIPTTFAVDIPDALSTSSTTKSSTVDALQGNAIYQHLRTFINVGEKSAQIVQDVMKAISKNNINKAMDFTYTSNDDNRVKHIVVIENAEYEGKSYKFQLTITDQANEAKADGGKALQVFWNPSPVDGVAILKFANINNNDAAKYPDFMARIDYDELNRNGYEQEMTVSLSKYPLDDTATNRYSLQNLKMFAGRNGDVIDVYGNSSHPNAWFWDKSVVGFNWAFVATSNRNLNIGIAEVGLPTSSNTSSDRTVLLKDNAIKTIFESQIKKTFPSLTQSVIDGYLLNTAAPGYFANGGFKAAGTAPSETASAFSLIQSRMDKLSPYQPSSVSNITIAFK